MNSDMNSNDSLQSLRNELRKVTAENRLLAEQQRDSIRYIREKVDQMLTVIGTVPLKPDELDDDTLLELDPIGIISDTFEQILSHLKETNIELETAHDDIQAIFDSVGEGILVLNCSGEIIAYNKKMTSLFAGSPPTILGRRCRDIVCEGATSEAFCLFRLVMDRQKSVRARSWECRGRFYEIIGTPIFNKNGELQRIVILYMDITRRKKTETALLESENRFRDLFENATDIVLSLAPDGRILMVNKAWRDVLGYGEAELRDMTMFDILHPDHIARCRANFESILVTGREFSSQTVFLSKNGREVPVDGRVNCKSIDGRPVALRCIFRDISEKLQLEEELRRMQKLEAIGLLAGGIAHDFNNLLTGIIGNIMLAKLKSPNEELTHLLENTEKASYRARELTRQLLTFARGGAPVKETASVVDVIRDVASFTLRGSNTRWTLEAEEDISPVELDTGQFGQVIQNLVLNSDQAMPDGGVIAIRVANCAIGDKASFPLPAGSYVRIRVADEGIGIAREYLSRIFDPYFSTKRKGSGLGLATSYAIIRNHNGLITVDSELGAGTVMTIYLPAAAGPAPPKEQDELHPVRGKGKVLVMDDDEIVRTVALQMLTHLGYKVIESSDGLEAITLYQRALEKGEPFDVVILDLTVPGRMGGKETIARLLRIDPSVRAIVSSGYSNDPVMADFKEYGFSAVVPKPYSLNRLGAAVHSLCSR